MTNKETTCKKCKRAVYTKDVDAQGRCVFCREEKADDQRK